MSRRTDWHAMADATITKLGERFPKCFDLRRSKPLKIGINADLVAAMAGEMTPVQIGAALARYVHGIAYKRSLLAGTPRVDLQGRPAGTVSASEEAEAWDASPPVRRARRGEEAAGRQG
jgi:sRNA-binding protein